MSIVRAHLSVSLDGYVAGPRQTVENPLGEGGEGLHAWVVETRVWREAHGLDGGVDNASTPVMEEETRGVGAEIMGRGKFGPPGGGPWRGGEAAEEWRGWWGEDPPFHKPVFVLTHHAREPLTLSDTTFTFVTGGIVEALDRATDAARGQDVLVGGGADVVNQYLAAGLVDELSLHVAPVLLGGGARLFDGARPGRRLEQLRVVEAPGVAHLSYRVVR